MLRSIPYEILPYGQNQCPTGKNHQLPADINGTHPGGVGEAARIHPSMPLPWDGELASALELLQWVNTHVDRAPRCRCWWRILITHHQQGYNPDQEDGGKSRLGEDRTPAKT
jgi:hypothetical protein